MHTLSQAAALSFALSASPASGSPSVAVGPVTTVGGTEHAVADVDPPRLREAVAEGLRRGDVDIQVLGDSCLDRACWVGAARDAGVAHLAFLVLERQGPDHHLSLEVVASNDGRTIASVSESCEICGDEEVIAATADLAAALLPRLQRLGPSPAILVLQGGPAGAAVEVDGEAVGTMPWEGELEPGEHSVRVSHEAHLPAHRTVVVNEGIREQLAIQLRPRGATPVDEARRRDGIRLAIGGSLLGAGVVAVGVGVGLFAFDGRGHQQTCVGSGVDADGDCELLHETTTPAIVATSIGAAAVVSGAAVLVHTLVRRRRGERATQARLRPARGGVLVRF